MATARRVIQIDVTTTAGARKAVQDLNKRLRSIESSSQKAAKSLRRMGTNINFMALAAKGYIALRFATAITDASDAMVLLQNRIRLVADQSMQLTDVMSDLFGAAATTRADVEATGNLYQRLALATKDLGVSHEDLLKTVQAVSNSLLLSGAGAQEAKALMIQLSQAMAKGKLDGDEFRSVMENNAVAADLLAKQFGVTRGELFELSKQGKITTEEMLQAFINGADEMQAKVDEMSYTFGQVYTELSNQTLKFLSFWQEEFGAATKWIRDVVVGGFEEMNAAIEREKNLVIGFEDSPQARGEIEKILKQIEDVQKQLSGESWYGFFVTDEHLETQLKNLRARLREVQGDAVEAGRNLDELRRAAGETPEFGPQKVLGEPVGKEKPEEAAKKTVKALKEVVSWQERFRQSIVDTQTDIDRYEEKINILDNLYFDGAISVEVYTEALEKLTGVMTENAVPATEEFSEAMQIAIAGSVVDSIGSMTDAFVDFALTGKSSFRELASSVLADMSKMILKMVVLNSLKNAFSGQTSGFGGAINNVLTGSFATGTPYVPQDGLAYLHKGERVVPASQNQVTNNNNYTTTTERPITIVNSVDPGQIGEIMGGSIGEEVIINHIRRNPDLVRQVLA